MPMRYLAIACLLLFVPLPAAAQSAPDIVLSEILPDPGTQREFIELRNDGAASVDLTGWQILDAAGNTFTFPAWDLAPGAHVVVWGGGEPTGAGPAWSKSSVWNNGGDEARLLDPAGAVVDAFAYGTHANATAAAPETGKSLNRGEPWNPGVPSPGTAPGGTEGQAVATVENVAPAFSEVLVPDRLHRGEAFTLSFFVDDDNGDLAHWNITDAAGTLANGNTTAYHDIPLTAPSTPGPWTLNLAAIDSAGATASSTHTIDVAISDLEVDLDGPIAFDAMVPGATNVTAQPFNVTNAGPEAVDPYIDISDFTGPGSASILVTNNVHIGWSDGNTTTWILYDGPLTRLPALASGETRSVTLQILHVPLPLAAGEYGTTFTLVA